MASDLRYLSFEGPGIDLKQLLALGDVLAVFNKDFLDLPADLRPHGNGGKRLDIAHGRHIDGHILADHLGHFDGHRAGVAALAFLCPSSPPSWQLVSTLLQPCDYQRRKHQADQAKAG